MSAPRGIRLISGDSIVAAVADMCAEANFDLPADVLAALQAARDGESSPVARDVLEQLIDNARIAREQRIALCQDCGIAVIFAELGRDAHLDADLQDSIDRGVRQGYREAYLRKSMVCDPLRRNTNTGDNTPAIVHLKLVEGDRLTLTLAPKGGGSENMSAVWMLVPSEGEDGVVTRIAERIRQAGGKPCPPLILGVGLGGNLEKSALMAKESLLRPVGQPSPVPEVAALEARILAAVNATGVGPMGLGGNTTALAVHVERYPCHIASLPLALNVQCHAARHVSRVL